MPILGTMRVVRLNMAERLVAILKQPRLVVAVEGLYTAEEAEEGVELSILAMLSEPEEQEEMSACMMP